MKIRAFIVEDSVPIRENLIETLEEVVSVSTVGVAETEAEGAAWLLEHEAQWDLAIVDLFLKEGNGLGILKAGRSRRPLQKMVVFSNYATQEVRRRCAALGVDAVFDKSTEIDALLLYCIQQSDRNHSSAIKRH